MVLKNLMKLDKQKQNKVVSNNSVGKTNTKVTIDVKSKNRKSQ